jgi:hypothetical protein
VLLKRTDDKSKRLSLLQDLQQSTLLDARQKKWLREELNRTRIGIQGESESAYFLDQYFKDGENHVLLHDLRFVVDGDVAQIDHLIINRGLGVYLIETKNYSGNVVINESGEFTVDYDGDRFGVPSPIEQSHRHARVLQKVLERLEITGRLGAPLECYHVVMFHPKAVITRPPKKAFDSSNVIKADQFPSWHAQFVDKELGVAKILRMTVNLRSLDTIKEWGEKLKRQHRPANLLELPDFMTAKEPAPPVEPKPIAVKPAPAVPPNRQTEAERIIAGVKQASEPGAKRLICLQCNSKISYPEGKFCWNNSVRFKGGQYCREHQSLF